MSELQLVGLDGGNPLGFLAALGTLRASGQAFQKAEPRLGWILRQGCWHPILVLEATIDENELLAGLHRVLAQRVTCPARSIADDLNLTTSEFRRHAIALQCTCQPQQREAVDFMAAFAFDQHPSDSRQPEGSIADTALRTMSGAGHQHFLKTMRDLASLTTITDLESALFHPWEYRDSKPSLRWDPVDDRRYALRWQEPATDPVRTVRGANRLAIEALPFYPVAPVKRRLETTGFVQDAREHARWRWPIWTCRVGVETARSVLSHPSLNDRPLDRDRLARLGVAEVYESRRLTLGKYRNFSPAVPAGDNV
jgi:hypothetical protein